MLVVKGENSGTDTPRVSASPSVPVMKRWPRRQGGHKLLCCGPAGAPAPGPQGAISGSKGHFCAHAHLITGPIWSVPTVKQTPVLQEMDFRRQTHCSHRSPQQLSCANCLPSRVTVARPNCSPRGDRLCRLAVIGKCLIPQPDFKKVFHWGALNGLLFATHPACRWPPNSRALLFRMAYSHPTGEQPCKVLTG